eukprot:scaffold1442_cov212-Alexandrium_tamarense.AAC.12
MDAGIDNMRDTKSFQDINDNVHQMTMESIETYCKRKHINLEEKMLNAMVSSYEGRVRGGEVEERKQRNPTLHAVPSITVRMKIYSFHTSGWIVLLHHGKGVKKSQWNEYCLLKLAGRLLTGVAVTLLTPKLAWQQGIDLISRQRIASYDFYVSTTGDEWTNNYLWAEEFTTHCLWYGVDCDAVTGHTTVFQAS